MGYFSTGNLAEYLGTINTPLYIFIIFLMILLVINVVNIIDIDSSSRVVR